MGFFDAIGDVVKAFKDGQAEGNAIGDSIGDAIFKDSGEDKNEEETGKPHPLPPAERLAMFNESHPDSLPLILNGTDLQQTRYMDRCDLKGVSYMDNGVGFGEYGNHWYEVDCGYL